MDVQDVYGLGGIAGPLEVSGDDPTRRFGKKGSNVLGGRRIHTYVRERQMETEQKYSPVRLC